MLVRNKLNKWWITYWPAPSWLVSSVGRLIAPISQRSRIRIPHRPEFFCQALFSLLLKLCSLLRSSLSCSFRFWLPLISHWLRENSAGITLFRLTSTTFYFCCAKRKPRGNYKNHFHSINYCNDVLIVSSKTANVIIIANPSKSPRFCRNITRRFLSDLDVMLANISGTWDGNNEALFVMVTVALKHKRMEC